MDHDVAPPVRAFLESKIDSVELLHVLMLLRERPETEWSMRAISDELRSSESSVAKRIRSLIERGVLAADAERDGVVHYLPRDAEMGETVDRAIEVYRRRPYRVVELIFSRRKDPIRSIADAFRFRKKEDEG